MAGNEEIIQNVSEMRVEVKYMARTLVKMEKVFEEFSGLMEKQSTANKRILNLETDIKNLRLEIKILEWKIRKIEDWQLKIVTIATVFATAVWFLLNKFF